MKASDLFVKALENEGVTHIFGVPGEENLDLVESLRTSSIKLVVTRHEQGAGFMAATYGRLTGKTGVCLSTLGPGATNLVTAAAYAQLGAMPMLMITGQKPIKKSKQGHFQIIDTVRMMTPLTKYSKQIINGNTIPANVREAFRLAEEERPGAVHLELPEDIAAEEADAPIFEIHKIRRPEAEVKAVGQAVEMIQQAKHPLILVGAGANRKLISKMLTEFIHKTGIPFFNTQMGKGVIDERHPLFIGTAALSDKDYVHCAVEKADLIINVGHDVVEKPPFFMKQNGQKVIHVNFFSAQVDPVYFPQWEVLGDIGNAIWKIKEAIVPQAHWNFDYFLKVKKANDEHTMRDAASNVFPMLPQRIIADVRSAMPEDGIVTLDNGMYKIWFARQYKAFQQNTLLLDNALATMGAGLPSAMEAYMVHPDRKIVAVCGDGGFMMNSQELETAIRLDMNVVILILNDNAYGMIKWKQTAMGHADFGLNFNNPDFVQYARAYGAKGYRVNSAEEFKPLLEKCLSTPGVQLIEVPINYDVNHTILTEELGGGICPV